MGTRCATAAGNPATGEGRCACGCEAACHMLLNAAPTISCGCGAAQALEEASPAVSSIVQLAVKVNEWRRGAVAASTVVPPCSGRGGGWSGRRMSGCAVEWEAAEWMCGGVGGRLW